MQNGDLYKKARKAQFASQLRFFRQLCTAAKVPDDASARTCRLHLRVVLQVSFAIENISPITRIAEEPCIDERLSLAYS